MKSKRFAFWANMFADSFLVGMIMTICLLSFSSITKPLERLLFRWWYPMEPQITICFLAFAVFAVLLPFTIYLKARVNHRPVSYYLEE